MNVKVNSLIKGEKPSIGEICLVHAGTMQFLLGVYLGDNRWEILPYAFHPYLTTADFWIKYPLREAP